MAEENNGNGKKDEPSQEYDNFQRLLKQVVSTPKEEVDERRAEYKRERKKKRAGKALGVCTSPTPLTSTRLWGQRHRL